MCSGQLALKYKLDNEFELVFVVAYQKMLPLLYLDKLLDELQLRSYLCVRVADPEAGSGSALAVFRIRNSLPDLEPDPEVGGTDPGSGFFRHIAKQ